MEGLCREARPFAGRARSAARAVVRLSPGGLRPPTRSRAASDHLLCMGNMDCVVIIQRPAPGRGRAVEIARHIGLRDRAVLAHPKIAGIDDALNFLRPLFTGQDRELLVALCLGRDLRVRRCVRIPGSESSCPAPVRRILLSAMQSRSPILLLAHNHPSEDPRPSVADKSMTRQIARACRDIDVRLVDHIVIGGNRFTSFRGMGEL